MRIYICIVRLAGEDYRYGAACKIGSYSRRCETKGRGKVVREVEHLINEWKRNVK